jgi:SAM-dependent methyltransferase
VTRLNLGCGTDLRDGNDGWVNVDMPGTPGVDVGIDLDAYARLPWADGSVTEIHASHVIEHLHHPLHLMDELWRVARPGAMATIRCPYGSSDDADEDPTHVRRMFLRSWDYFAQPMYWRADYGYRGDWHCERVHLFVTDRWADAPESELWAGVVSARNVVREMVAILTAVKPARPQDKALQTQPEIVFHR